MLRPFFGNRSSVKVICQVQGQISISNCSPSKKRKFTGVLYPLAKHFKAPA